MVTREQLELVVQKKKINELYNWFHNHFLDASQEAYMSKCPFLIIQGPAGCGKTTTLKFIAKQLQLPIKEYNDTTDTTAMNYELNNHLHANKDCTLDDKTQDRRRATRFEHYVFNNLRFNPLYDESVASQSQLTLACADSEFDDSDDDHMPPTQINKCPPPALLSGIIIHIESPLMFARSQKIFMTSIAKMIKMIREISRTNPRRIAVVFELLESDKDVLALPTKFKQTINMQMIKFNPIIRANMRKFIDQIIWKHQNIVMDRDTIDTLITDCDGDLQACINTMEMIRTKSHTCNNVYMGLDDDVDVDFDVDDTHMTPSKRGFQVSKKQRLNPERFKLNTTLMRDITRSLGFFHILGKIFYQKRLYPEIRHGANNNTSYRRLDRPYPTENGTEYLIRRLEAEPKRLLPWLHQHYYRFCSEANIEKASLFMDNLSEIDTISMNSLQSSQFYEMHSTIDQIQLYLAVESTVFSLYQDQSRISKSSHKKTRESYVIKSSVESFTQNANGELYSFSKPVSLSVTKVIEDHQAILAHCSNELFKQNLNCTDQTKILTDYIPYLKIMSDNGHTDSKVDRFIKILERIEDKKDYDADHEALLEILEEISGQ